MKFKVNVSWTSIKLKGLIEAQRVLKYNVTLLGKGQISLGITRVIHQYYEPLTEIELYKGQEYARLPKGG